MAFLCSWLSRMDRSEVASYHSAMVHAVSKDQALVLALSLRTTTLGKNDRCVRSGMQTLSRLHTRYTPPPGSGLPRRSCATDGDCAAVRS